MTTNKVRAGVGSNASSADLSKLLVSWLEAHGAVGILRTCASCHHMTIGNEPAFCTKFNVTPPANIIVAGCPEHSDREEIPF
jgi:hypothetical protein